MAPKPRGKKRKVSGGAEQQQQQTLVQALERRPAAVDLPLEVQHAPAALPEAFCQEMVRQYDAYRERQGYAGANPTAATAAAPAAAAGAGRTRCSGRRKFANIKYREGSTESDAKPARQDSTAAVDSDAEDEGAGGGGSNSARWEARATAFIAQTSKWTSGEWTLPIHMQAALVHMIVNNGMHTDPSISMQAYSLLQALVHKDPPVKVLPAEDGLPMRLQCHDAFWHPLVKDCYLPSRLGNGFILLHRTAAALVDAAHGSEPQLAAGEQPPPGSPEGRVQGLALLFSHLVGLMQVDALGRLRVWRASEKGPRATALLKQSLLWRLLQDDAGSSWQGDRSKGHLVRNLVTLMALGAAHTEAPSTAATTSSASGTEHTHEQQRQQRQGQFVGAAGLGELSRRLLRLMLALLGAAEESGVFGEGAGQRTREHAKNDRMELDRVLLDCMVGTDMLQELRPHGAKLLLLGALQPRDRVRLLCILAAEVYAKLGAWKDKVDCKHLDDLHSYFSDGGKASTSYQEGDAPLVISYLSDKTSWANKAFFGGQPGFVTFVAALIHAEVDRAGMTPELAAAAGALLQQCKADGLFGRGDIASDVLATVHSVEVGAC